LCTRCGNNYMFLCPERASASFLKKKLQLFQETLCPERGKCLLFEKKSCNFSKKRCLQVFTEAADPSGRCTKEWNIRWVSL
jgi:hypothetical protein